LRPDATMIASAKYERKMPAVSLHFARPELLHFRAWAILAAAICCLQITAQPEASEAVPEAQPIAPSSPREIYNAGTLKLQEGKLREAEAFLQSVLASQQERLQTPTLYNLGHVRFRQGAEELKKGPSSGASINQGQSAGQNAATAITAAEEALREGNVERMVSSYLRGRGTRRELRAAMSAVKRALDSHGAALMKWQRASGDFHSALELNANHAEARHNAQVVDRNIAKLVDSIRELQQMAAMLGAKKKELQQKMQQLKGQIPEPDMPPGAAGDDEEEEEQPKGPEPGQKEPPAKQGEEMALTPEQAGWLLEGFKLDTERRLPMGQENTSEPRNRPGKDW
jgi:tetratricopeptide (TPR) repeat protein